MPTHAGGRDRSVAGYRRSVAALPTRICEHCEIEYAPRQHNQQYCTRRCNQLATRVRERKISPIVTRRPAPPLHGRVDELCPTCRARLVFGTDGNGRTTEWCPNCGEYLTPQERR